MLLGKVVPITLSQLVKLAKQAENIEKGHLIDVIIRNERTGTNLINGEKYNGKEFMTFCSDKTLLLSRSLAFVVILRIQQG